MFADPPLWLLHGSRTLESTRRISTDTTASHRDVLDRRRPRRGIRRHPRVLRRAIGRNRRSVRAARGEPLGLDTTTASSLSRPSDAFPRRGRSPTLGEADRAQLGCQVLPLPGALSFLRGLTVSAEAHGFRGVGRSVRSVVEHVGYRARLTGCTSSGDGGGRSCFGRVACGRMCCERSGAARRHRKFTAFPSSECRDRCAWSIVTGALLLEDRQSAFCAARRPQCDRVMDRRLRVRPLRFRLFAHASIVSGIKRGKIGPPQVVSRGHALT